MSGTTYHLGLSVRGALMNWPLREYADLITDDAGKLLGPRDAKAYLLDELAAGHERLPCAPCDNWDWKKGCQGHREPELLADAAPCCEACVAGQGVHESWCYLGASVHPNAPAGRCSVLGADRPGSDKVGA